MAVEAETVRQKGGPVIRSVGRWKHVENSNAAMQDWQRRLFIESVIIPYIVIFTGGAVSQPEALWPVPVVDMHEQPHFLFLVTPPFSGSTAIAELLNSSPFTTLIQARGEGQWLIPGLCEDDRWDVNKAINYASVKAVWLQAWQEALAAQSGLKVVIEKSPPNMLRIRELLALFNETSLLANNRNPYACCASMLYSNFTVESLAESERLAQLARLAHEWLLRSRCIKALVEELSIPLLTYEQFCANPSLIIALLKLPQGVAETIDPQALVKVKGYALQGIVNQNPRQLALLSEDDVACISAVLAQDVALLDFFGYALA